jgi:hypothetical protein
MLDAGPGGGRPLAARQPRALRDRPRDRGGRPGVDGAALRAAGVDGGGARRPGRRRPPGAHRGAGRRRGHRRACGLRRRPVERVPLDLRRRGRGDVRGCRCPLAGAGSQPHAVPPHPARRPSARERGRGRTGAVREAGGAVGAPQPSPRRLAGAARQRALRRRRDAAALRRERLPRGGGADRPPLPTRDGDGKRINWSRSCASSGPGGRTERAPRARTRRRRWRRRCWPSWTRGAEAPARRDRIDQSAASR